MFSASIAFTFFLSLSGIAFGAPMAETRAATVQQIQACSGVNGTGNCTPINFAPGVNEGDFDPAGCTNITDIDVKSFIMDVEDVCTLYFFDDCDVGDSFAQEIFEGDDITNNLNRGARSVSCVRVDGLVRGLFPQ